MGSNLIRVTGLCPLKARHINPCLVLVQPRKTRPGITENCCLGRKESIQTKATSYAWVEVFRIFPESKIQRVTY